MNKPINVFGPGNMVMNNTVMVSDLILLMTGIHAKQITDDFY